MINLTIISKITTQKKRTDRYNIFLDDGQGEEYAFSVDEAVLIQFQLRKSMELTKEMIEEILSEDKIRKGYHYAINFLSYRMRTKKEMNDYLTKKELGEEDIRIVIQRLTKEDYLNNLEFAKAFVRSRINLTLKGPGAIKKELFEKGVSEADINESLELFSMDQQLEKVMTFIEKKSTRNGRTSRKEQDRKVYSLLLSKGFSQDIIQQALSILKEQEDEIEQVEADLDEEWQAVTYQGEKAMKKYQSKDGWEKKQKVKQFLYARGFSMELIAKFIDEYEDSE